MEKNLCKYAQHIIDVKFDKESKSELRIELPCKEKPENAENLSNNHKIACRKKRFGKIPSAPITI